MVTMRVLVVEDNAVVADAVAEGLRDQGMAVDVAYDGASGLEKVTVNGYDVVVLDRDLPRLHGDELCAQIISSPCASRILMLTAAGQVEDRVDGLNLGADDYLAKPFDFSELVARVRALARRSPSAPPVLHAGRPRRRSDPPHGDAGRSSGAVSPKGTRRTRSARFGGRRGGEL